MTKTVFSNSQACHVWAQRVGYSVRGSHGNIYSSGDGQTIYSYGSHFPMARFVGLPEGSPLQRADNCIVFMTTQGYSVSTSKHLSYVRSAISHRYVIRVTRPALSVAEQFKWAADAMDAALVVAAAPLALTKKGQPTVASAKARDSAVTLAQKWCDLGNEIAGVFCLDERLSMPDDLVGYLEQRNAEIKAAEEAEALRRAEAEKQWVANNQDGINAWCEGKGGAYSPHLAPEQLATRRATEEANAIAWKQGIEARGAEFEPCSYHLPGRTLLRRKDDTIETSRGAEFPVAHAIGAFKIIALAKSRGLLPYDGGFPAMRLGHFKIDKVDAKGNVTAGCHYVEWCEVEDMAIRLGLIPAFAHDPGCAINYALDSANHGPCNCSLVSRDTATNGEG